MRYLIVSDMHGNWDALEAVFRRVKRKRFDAQLVLGDYVGYGASPNQVVEGIRQLGKTAFCVRGNHDKVVAAIESGDSFNELALAAVNWTKQRLKPDNRRYLRDLKRGPLVVESAGMDLETPRVAICHGSPLDEDVYLFSERDAVAAFRCPPAAEVTFFGHTHLPSLFVLQEGRIAGVLLRGEGALELQPGNRYLVNPGSIGQPRDRNPRAAFMTYDSDRRMLRWYRTRYAVARAQRRIVAAGLPPVLAERLALGV